MLQLLSADRGDPKTVERLTIIRLSLRVLPLLLFLSVQSFPQDSVSSPQKQTYTLETCINALDPARIESTKVGFQYWFANPSFADGKTVKLSVVRPGRATHAPHTHREDEFFFVLEGSAEVFLEGRTRVVGPMTNFYAPSGYRHGIRNVGTTELRYLVIKRYNNSVDISPFWDSSHHWFDINDERRTIDPVKNQSRYDETDVALIADNILLFQKSNGGWAKNYDMMAILTQEQKDAVRSARDELDTGFDNGATFTQVEYLARAFAITKDPKHKEGAIRGLRFILDAQYPNGGWPQFFPDTSGYRRYITFNDGAMVGVMKVLRNIVRGDDEYGFLPADLRAGVVGAFRKGIDVILRTQVVEEGERTVWCQQHDNRTLEPRKARSFELASLSSMESAEIVLFLMSLKDPSREVVETVRSAVQWFERTRIFNIRVKTVSAQKAEYQFHTTDKDRQVVEDLSAPAIWPRFTELKTGRPLFANRDGMPVYTLAEVERERRTGYAWYTYDPQEVLRVYAKWRVKTAGGGN